MEEEKASETILMLPLISMLTSAFSIQPLMAEPSEPPNIEWSKTYGGADYDGVWFVQQISDEWFNAAGYTNSFGTGAYAYWLVKTYANGNMEWSPAYGKAGIDMACSIKQTSDLGYIVAGSTDSGRGNYDLWLMKLAPKPPKGSIRGTNSHC